MAEVRAELKKSKWRLKKHEFLTAYHYAMQYRQWKDEVWDAVGIKASADDGQPKAATQSDPTQRDAIRISALMDNIRMIERTAEDAGGDLAAWLLYAVTTERATYQFMRERRGMPCGRRQYYEARRKFYYLLSKRIQQKNEVGYSRDKKPDKFGMVEST